MKFGNPVCFSKGVSLVPLLSPPSSPYGAISEPKKEEEEKNHGRKKLPYTVVFLSYLCGFLFMLNRY